MADYEQIARRLLQQPTNGNRFMSRVSSFDGRMPAPRNTNNRVNMRPKLGVVE